MSGVVIDTDQLIPLVEARPIIWDKTLDIYKDRSETRKAWMEVFKKLNEGFEDLGDEEKNAYGKEVMKRWGNVRDSFKKCERKQRGKSTSRNYIYAPQLQFLKKLIHEHQNYDCLSVDNETQEDDRKAQTPGGADKSGADDQYTFSQQKTRKRKLDHLELLLVEAVKEKSDRHMSFFRGIIPSLRQFDDDEVVEFQLAVVQTMAAIKKRKTTLNNISQQETTSRWLPNLSLYHSSPSNMSQLRPLANEVELDPYAAPPVKRHSSSSRGPRNRSRHMLPADLSATRQRSDSNRRTVQFNGSLDQEVSTSPSISDISENSSDSFDFAH